MKQYVIVSAMGKDRPGFVNRITHTINELGGNIELQRSTRMAAEFAMLVLFSLEKGEMEAAIERLNGLRDEELLLNARPAVSGEQVRPADARIVDLIASGADQPGIIDTVTRLLFKNGINIESMDYDTESAPFTGEHLFRMSAKVAVPGEVDIGSLRDSLRALEDEYNFDVLIRQSGGTA